MMTPFLVGLLVLGTASVLVLRAVLRRKQMHLWIGSYTRQRLRRNNSGDDRPLHVFLAVGDHYEPEWGQPARSEAIERVEQWCQRYPQQLSAVRDDVDVPPQHTFFFPQDQYAPEYLDRLKRLCEAGYGDVDVHLHHDNDTESGLREKLAGFRDTLWNQHGLLRLSQQTGQPVYGFIHGNWALCNSRPDGRWCGVDREIDVLLETGCYADFTLPSAPSATQTTTINSIYYARQLDSGPKSHDTGRTASVGRAAGKQSLLMIQGPLGLDFKHRKHGLLPRIENGDMHATMPPTLDRFRIWLNCQVGVVGRPDWRFIKLHTHGCNPGNLNMLLGDEYAAFHHALADYRRQHPNLRLYYVTAWEMAQLVQAAELGSTDPVQALSRIRNTEDVMGWSEPGRTERNTAVCTLD